MELVSTRSPERNFAIALHEAGHAIAAVRLGFEVTRVTIEPNEEFSGRCEIVDSMFLDLRAVKHGQLFLLAGHATDLANGVPLELAREIAEADRWFARTVRTQLGLRRERPWLARARRFVRDPANHRAIELLASVLFFCHTLDGNDVGRVVRVADGTDEVATAWFRSRMAPFADKLGIAICL